MQFKRDNANGIRIGDNLMVRSLRGVVLRSTNVPLEQIAVLVLGRAWSSQMLIHNSIQSDMGSCEGIMGIASEVRLEKASLHVTSQSGSGWNTTGFAL
jgi:hypothetical protein